MPREHGRLDGTPSARKSGTKWDFSSEIPASVHYSDLTVFGLGWRSREIVCCESSAFILRPPSFVGMVVALASVAAEFGAAVALRAQGDGARGELDLQVS